MAGLRAHRSGDHYLLRLEEEFISGHHHGEDNLLFARRRSGCPAPHAISSDSVDGLRSVGPTVGSARRALSNSDLGKQERTSCNAGGGSRHIRRGLTFRLRVRPTSDTTSGRGPPSPCRGRLIAASTSGWLEKRPTQRSVQWTRDVQRLRILRNNDSDRSVVHFVLRMRDGAWHSAAGPRGLRGPAVRGYQRGPLSFAGCEGNQRVGNTFAIGRVCLGAVGHVTFLDKPGSVANLSRRVVE